MPRSIIFHIGDRKTGTTSIQYALKMKAHNIPATDIEWIDAPRISHTLWHPNDGAHYHDKWTSISNRIARSKARIVIISDENFELASAVSLRNAIKQFIFEPECYALRVLAYVRPHADRVISSYVQRLKHGHVSAPPRSFHTKTFADGEFLYAPRFERWREVFGPNFTLKAMIRRNLFRNDAVADFLKEISGKEDFILDDSIRDSNISPSTEELMEMRVFHDEYKARAAELPHLQSLHQPITKILLKSVTGVGTPFKLARPLVEKIAYDYGEDARQTDLQFFGGSPLMAEALAASPAKAIDHQISIDPNDHLTSARIAEIREWTNSTISKINMIPAKFRNRPLPSIISMMKDAPLKSGKSG